MTIKIKFFIITFDGATATKPVENEENVLNKKFNIFIAPRSAEHFLNNCHRSFRKNYKYKITHIVPKYLPLNYKIFIPFYKHPLKVNESIYQLPFLNIFFPIAMLFPYSYQEIKLHKIDEFSLLEVDFSVSSWLLYSKTFSKKGNFILSRKFPRKETSFYHEKNFLIF